MTNPLLQIRNVGWRSGPTTVLESVSLEVAAGEFVALMGRNGAGKSTLLDLMAGLRRPSDDTIALDGRPLDSYTPRDRARALSHLPQHLRVEAAMQARALVLMGRYPHASRWFETAADAEIAEAAMQRCGCSEFSARPLGTLSGGERQRVFLAACLAQQPKLLLLDEPATFLDVDQQLHCFSVLRHEADRGAACLAVTHDINLALARCTRIIVLAGRGVARDLLATSALDDPEWLQFFSPRLAVDRGTARRPWVCYQ